MLGRIASFLACCDLVGVLLYLVINLLMFVLCFRAAGNISDVLMSLSGHA